MNLPSWFCLACLFIYIPVVSPICDSSNQVDLRQLDLHLKRGNAYSHVWKSLGCSYVLCNVDGGRWRKASRPTWPMTSRPLNEAELFFAVTLRRLNLSSSRGRSYSNLTGGAKDKKKWNSRSLNCTEIWSQPRWTPTSLCTQGSGLASSLPFSFWWTCFCLAAAWARRSCPLHLCFGAADLCTQDNASRNLENEPWFWNSIKTTASCKGWRWANTPAGVDDDHQLSHLRRVGQRQLHLTVAGSPNGGSAGQSPRADQIQHFRIKNL